METGNKIPQNNTPLLLPEPSFFSKHKWLILALLVMAGALVTVGVFATRLFVDKAEEATTIDQKNTATQMICTHSGGSYIPCPPCDSGGDCPTCFTECRCSEGTMWKEGQGCVGKKNKIIYGSEAVRLCGPQPPVECKSGTKLGCSVEDSRWDCFSDSDLETSDWQTYRNEEYGFEIQYPKEYEVRNLTEENKPSFESLVFLVGLCKRSSNTGCNGPSIHIYQGEFRAPSISVGTHVAQFEKDDYTFWMGGREDIVSTFKSIEQ